MNTPALFKTYIWLIETIQSARKISFQELNELWLCTEMSGGVEMARSTFNRYKEAIESIFGIVIECDRRDNFRYYIDNEDVLRNNTMVKWMYVTADLSNIMRENMALKNRIFFCNMYGEEEYFKLVITAMKQGHMVEFGLIKSDGTKSKTYVMAPYCMKRFSHGWHMLGRFDNGDFAIVPLTLFSHLSMSTRTFTFDPQFSDEEFTNRCYGRIAHDNDEKRIKVRAKDNLRYCFIEKPLHPSQEIVEACDDYVDYAFTVKPTIDFVRLMLSRNRRVEVMSPQWLHDEVEKVKRNVFCVFE